MRVLFLLLPMLLVIPPETHAAPADAERCEIGLVLGSGGAAGLAHIELLRVFDELEIQPSRIAGTSIGAVIGVLYASGLEAATIEGIFNEFGGSGLDTITGLIRGNNGLDLRDVMNLDLENGGLVDAQGFIDFLQAQTPARSFDDLRIPMEIITTDYWTGQPVVRSTGPLFEAVQASMAVPGLFSPVRSGEQLLIDGGTTNPLPIDRLRADCDRVIAIDVSGARPRPGDETAAEFSDLLFGSFELMQQALIAQSLKQHRPDLYLKPEIRNVRLLHFNRIRSVLEQTAPEARRLRNYLQALVRHHEREESNHDPDQRIPETGIRSDHGPREHMTRTRSTP